jgi:hypothetical protein
VNLASFSVIFYRLFYHPQNCFFNSQLIHFSLFHNDFILNFSSILFLALLDFALDQERLNLRSFELCCLPGASMQWNKIIHLPQNQLRRWLFETQIDEYPQILVFLGRTELARLLNQFYFR